MIYIWCLLGWWAVVSGYKFLTFCLLLWQASSEVDASTVAFEVHFRSNSWSSHLWRCLPQMYTKCQEMYLRPRPPSLEDPYTSMTAVKALNNSYLTYFTLGQNSLTDSFCHLLSLLNIRKNIMILTFAQSPIKILSVTHPSWFNFIFFQNSLTYCLSTLSLSA